MSSKKYIVRKLYEFKVQYAKLWMDIYKTFLVQNQPLVNSTSLPKHGAYESLSKNIPNVHCTIYFPNISQKNVF